MATWFRMRSGTPVTALISEMRSISSPEFDAEYYTEGISFINDQPKKANRAISMERLNRFSKGYYEMGEFSCREALIMFNTRNPDYT